MLRMAMDSGDSDSSPTAPPENRLRRISRDNSNLRLNVEAARRRSQTNFYDDLNQFRFPDSSRDPGRDEVDCESDADVEEEGRELFTNFVQEEIKRAGLEEKQNATTPWPVETPIGYKNPVWAKAGKELREMADAFSKTKERSRVKQKACSMNIMDMTYCQFRDLMSELFLDHGITSERIVVLFSFCSDLALNNLEQAAVELFQRCIRWTWTFISENICAWVRDHGGWRVVLGDSVQFVGPRVVVAFAVVGVLAAIYHVMKR